MGNMSYCRFQNTVSDLADCYDNMDDEDLSPEEEVAKQRLIRIAQDIVGNYGEDY